KNTDRRVVKITVSSTCGESEPAPLVDASLPTSFALHPNQPNPFGAETRVRFDLPSESPTRIQVLDAGGRMVRLLVDRTLPAGSYAPPGGARAEGAAVAAGVAFFRSERPALDLAGESAPASSGAGARGLASRER